MRGDFDRSSMPFPGHSPTDLTRAARKASHLLVLSVMLCTLVCAGCGNAVEIGNMRNGSDRPQHPIGDASNTAVSLDQVRVVLDVDEPDYMKSAQLGGGALPHLARLSEGSNLSLAAKAVYLASLIRDPRSSALVGKAALSDHPTIRIAAAAATRNLARPDAIELLLVLLGDSDGGVRKVALTSVNPVIGSSGLPPALQARIESLVKADPEPHIRELARRVLQQ